MILATLESFFAWYSIQEHAQSGSCRNANPLSCAFARLFASALRAPGVRVRRAQPAAEHAHDLCFSASEFPASWPDTDEDFTRVDESPRHTPRQRPEGNSSPRRAASTRHNLWRCGFRGFRGDRSHGRTPRSGLRPPPSLLGGCLSPHSGESVYANPIQYVRICYINIVLGGIGSALRHNVNDGNQGAL